MVVRVRFAPSPTGRLHVGNIYIALHNWLYARKAGGEFLLRLDDTDRERSTEDFANGIKTDLEWLGLNWNLFDRQSQRLSIYDEAAERLREGSRLYPCYESAEELGLKRKVQLSQGKPPIYDRAALKLTDADRAKLEAEGKRPHWRFKLEPRRIAWNDLVRGPQHIDETSQSDPVLVREDGSYLYTLPSVVDDIELGISHVIRGDDHVTNTGVQIALFEALGATPPGFGHHNLLTTTTGEGLSKRTGALSISSLREAGIEPMAVAALAVLIGTSENVSAIPSMEELARHFDLAATSRSASKFDPAELTVLNKTLLHHMPFAEAKERLGALGMVGEKAEAFWNTVRGNLDTFDDARRWWRVVTEGPQPAAELSTEDRDFVRDAYDFLPLEPWDRDTWKVWTERVKEQSGRKGKALYLPLRLAITGLASGPELSDLLPILGREAVLGRRP